MFIGLDLLLLNFIPAPRLNFSHVSEPHEPILAIYNGWQWREGTQMWLNASNQCPGSSAAEPSAEHPPVPEPVLGASVQDASSVPNTWPGAMPSLGHSPLPQEQDKARSQVTKPLSPGTAPVPPTEPWCCHSMPHQILIQCSMPLCPALSRAARPLQPPLLPRIVYCFPHRDFGGAATPPLGVP